MTNETPVTPEPKKPPKAVKTLAKKPLKKSKSGGTKAYIPHPSVKFTMVTVRREQLKDAPYNPRIITDLARKRLKENLNDPNRGLMEPIVWNIRTGNLVSGHQRISVLDDIAQTKLYTLPVAQVDLDEKTEKEQNIFMNNPEAQGMFDVTKLEELFKTPNLTFEATGFSLGDVYNMFGDSPLEKRPEEYQKLAAQIQAVADARDQIGKMATDTRDNPDFFVVVVFKSPFEKAQFDKGMALSPEGVVDKFMDGRILAQRLGIKLTPEPEAEPKKEEKPNGKQKVKQKAKA